MPGNNKREGDVEEIEAAGRCEALQLFPCRQGNQIKKKATPATLIIAPAISTAVIFSL